MSGAESSFLSHYCQISPEEKMNIHNFYEEFNYKINDKKASKRFLENTIKKQKNDKLCLKIYETALYNEESNFED